MKAQSAPLRDEHAEPASSAQRATKSRLRAVFATALALGLAACGGAPIDEELAEWGDDAEESETSRLGTTSLPVTSPGPAVSCPQCSLVLPWLRFVEIPGGPVACPQCVLEPKGLLTAGLPTAGLLYVPLDMSSEAVTLSFMDPTQPDVSIALSLGREAHEHRVYVVPRSEFSFGQVRAAEMTDRSTGEVIPVMVL